MAYHVKGALKSGLGLHHLAAVVCLAAILPGSLPPNVTDFRPDSRACSLSYMRTMRKSAAIDLVAFDS